MTKESIERTILNFHPGYTVKRGGRVDYGQVDKDKTVFYAHVTYPVRFTYSDEQPYLIGRWTTQPVIALELPEVDIATGKPAVIALAYEADIRALPDGLAEKVAAHLNQVQQDFDTLYASLRNRPLLVDRVYGEWEV